MNIGALGHASRRTSAESKAHGIVMVFFLSRSDLPVVKILFDDVFLIFAIELVLRRTFAFAFTARCAEDILDGEMVSKCLVPARR